MKTLATLVVGVAGLLIAGASAHAHHNDKKGHPPAFAEQKGNGAKKAHQPSPQQTPARKHKKQPQPR